MIKINDRFEFERGDQCWNLHEWKDGTNPKTKEPTRSKTTTYHSKLEQICNAVIDRSAGDCRSVQDIVEAISVAGDDCAYAISSMSTPPEAHVPG